MRLQLKIISGFYAGREFEFAGEQTEIKLGRAADADVQLHEEDRACGRGIHARLVFEGGFWFVQADHDNGVLLAREGKSLFVQRGNRLPIGKMARLTLGENGPALRVMFTGDTSTEMAPTLRNKEKVADMPVGEVTSDLADAAASVRPGMRRVWIGVGVCFVAALVVGSIVLISSQRTRSDATRLEAALRSEIDRQRAQSDEGLSALKGEVAALDERTKQDLIAVLRAVEPSVVMLALADPSGNVQFVGTGWVVGDRQIATNAHVAQALARAGESKLTAVARRATSAGVESITIEKIDLHPGYLPWGRILADPTIHLRSGTAGAVRHESMIAPYDAAIVRTAQSCGPALAIASDATLRNIKAGDEVGYVGYPAENVFDPRSSPPALLTGRITRLTDFFYNPVAKETALLIHHNLPTVGGASGSPIVNRAGEVIAINSAGNFIGVASSTGATQPTRVPIGFNYGGSVEFIRECLNNSADERLKARNPQWQEKLRKFTMPAEDLLDAFAEELLSDVRESTKVGSSPKFVRIFESRHTIASGRDAGAVLTIELTGGDAGLVQACADDRSDIDLEIAADEGFKSILGADNSADSFPRLPFAAPKTGKCWVRVYADATVLEHPTVLVRVSRLVK